MNEQKPQSTLISRFAENLHLFVLFGAVLAAIILPLNQRVAEMDRRIVDVGAERKLLTDYKEATIEEITRLKSEKLDRVEQIRMVQEAIDKLDSRLFIFSEDAKSSALKIVELETKIEHLERVAPTK